MPGVLDGAEPVRGLLCRVTGGEAGNDFFVFREDRMADVLRIFLAS
jgi:hypothetical protein